MRLSRRNFLRLSFAGLAGLAFRIGPESEPLPPPLNVPNYELTPSDFDGIPRMAQIDVPADRVLHIARGTESYSQLANGNEIETEAIMKENGFYPSSMELVVSEGTPLFIPAKLTRDVNATHDQLVKAVTRGLAVRIVNFSDVTEDHHFAMREQAFFGQIINNRVLPALPRYLQERPLMSGVVLLGRPSAAIIDRYKKSEGQNITDLNGFRMIGKFPRPNSDTVSFIRDGSTHQMVKGYNDKDVVLARIYLMHEPDDELKSKLMKSPFNPLDRGWQHYMPLQERLIAHEITHLWIDGYQLPPFDTHNIVHAVSMGVFLDMIYGSGRWDLSHINPGLINSPEFKVLQYEPGFYKYLLNLLSIGRRPYDFEYIEKEVRNAANTIFKARPTLASLDFNSWWTGLEAEHQISYDSRND